MRLLLATGGTGGHVYPALAVAREARARGFEAAVIGGAGGMEERLCAEAGVPFLGVATGKLDRERPDPRALLRAARGCLQAAARVRRWRPDVVAGFGGFASLPGCAGAVLARRPLALVEANAYPGLVTRLFARRAALVATVRPEVEARLPGARRFVRVGYPVREERVPRTEARARLGLPQGARVLLAMGGSQGSAALNAALVEALGALRDAGLGRDLVLLHATGRARLAEVEAAVARRWGGPVPGYRPVPYVDAPLAWSAADAAITRAGIGTLAEAALHGVPLVMVPLPSSAEDHQLHNARSVEAAGGGEVVEQATTLRDPAALAAAALRRLEPAVRADAARAQRALATPGAAAGLLDALAAAAPPSAGGRARREGRRARPEETA